MKVKEMKDNREKCYVLFPGKFKPFHDGHMDIIKKYLACKEYQTYVTIIISKVDKDGMKAATTKWFLDKLFADYKRVKVIISRDNSPIATAYDMTGQKEYGDGKYTMVSSNKKNKRNDDGERTKDFVTLFKKGGKYYTNGVEPIKLNVDTTPLRYKGRPGINGDISATVIRKDAKHGDYDLFRTAYLRMIEDGDATENLIKAYYSTVRNELNSKVTESLDESINEEMYDEFLDPLMEGGAAGHMDHPYEMVDWTFNDLKNLIIDIFAGKITDVTEKLDGQNLFASVDNDGNTIFARNQSQLFFSPWYLDDVRYNPKWIGHPNVQHAFTNAAETVDKVFKNIPNRVTFFNYDDKADGVRYRFWVNLEIIDTQNFNVIPYAESKVSFHGFKASVFDYSEIDAISKEDCDQKHEIIDIPQEDEKMEVLQQAIEKTDNTAFKAQITPHVIFDQIADGRRKADAYNREIDTLLYKFGLDGNDTINKYKETAFRKYLTKSKASFATGPMLDAIISKWVYGNKGITINNILKMPLQDGTVLIDDLAIKEQRDALKNDFKVFVDKEIPLIFKAIMAPLDAVFIKLGNEVIKSVKGLENAGHEKETIRQIKNELKDIVAGVENSDDEGKKQKLELALRRFAYVNNELNSTEGIIFKYNGHTLKLTGSFAPLNQLFGMKMGKFNR